MNLGTHVGMPLSYFLPNLIIFYSTQSSLLVLPFPAQPYPFILFLLPIALVHNCSLLSLPNLFPFTQSAAHAPHPTVSLHQHYPAKGTSHMPFRARTQPLPRPMFSTPAPALAPTRQHQPPHSCIGAKGIGSRILVLAVRRHHPLNLC